MEGYEPVRDGMLYDMTVAPLEAVEKRISLIVEDIEDGHGDYKLLAGFYEALAIIREAKGCG